VAEHGHRIRQPDIGGLVLHRLPTGCRLACFDQRGVLLGHLVHLGDGLVDLLDAGGLFWLAEEISPMMSVTRRTLCTMSSMVLPASCHQAAAGFDLAAGVVDQALDFLGGGGRALRQVAHFARHDRETAALLAGARRFHGRIERQDIGLEGDAVDDAMMSTIFLPDAAWIWAMVSTTCSITLPPRVATPDAVSARYSPGARCRRSA
jgi:hypothetical protein